ncbi:MAG: polyprenyl synthetase family protein [Pseudomonadota bacterium]
MSVDQEDGDFLAAVERRVELALRDDAPLVAGGPGVLAQAARHLCLGGGKRARPRLVSLLGMAVDAPGGALLDLAVAAELIHAASLLHDDVVDDGRWRRGQPTVNVRWGNSVAVLAGDWLLTRSFAMLRDYPRAITSEAIDVVAAMARSAMLEIEARGRLGVSTTIWEAIAEGKTGMLFGWCGSAPALLMSSDDAARRFGQFGRRLGIAFQLADDLKDLFGGEPGKDRFSDIRNGNPSFPIIVAAATSTRINKLLSEAWSQPPVSETAAAEIGNEILASGAADSAVDRLGQEIELTIESLGPYRHQPVGKAMLALARSFAGSFAGSLV